MPMGPLDMFTNLGQSGPMGLWEEEKKTQDFRGPVAFVGTSGVPGMGPIDDFSPPQMTGQDAFFGGDTQMSAYGYPPSA